MPRQAPRDTVPETQATSPDPPALWTEHLPPKLTPETVQHMLDTFKKNYPGEHIDTDSMPSLRLLSLVHEAMQRKHLKFIPWQLRLSQKQYQEAIEAKATKMPRTELQLLSSEVPVDNRTLTYGWLWKIQTVFRNALAICQAAHLSTIKAYDKKVLYRSRP